MVKKWWRASIRFTRGQEWLTVLRISIANSLSSVGFRRCSSSRCHKQATRRTTTNLYAALRKPIDWVLKGTAGRRLRQPGNFTLKCAGERSGGNNMVMGNGDD
jgi:hypothetical protein